MLSYDSYFAIMMLQNLSTQIAKATIPQHSHSFATSESQLFWNSTGGGYGFNEDSLLIRNMIGNRMQIHFRNTDLFGERTIMLNDPDNCPIRAVTPQIPSTHFAIVTGTVDFTRDALAGKSTGLSDPDELVPQDSSEAHIPLT